MSHSTSLNFDSATFSNLALVSGHTVHYTPDNALIANAINCYQRAYKPDSTKLKPHQIAARLLMDYGKNISLADYGFLIFVSTRQELTPRDRERFAGLFLEHSAIATSLICGLPLPEGGQTNV